VETDLGAKNRAVSSCALGHLGTEARPCPTSPAAPSGSRPAAPLAPSSAQGCCSAARGSRAAGSGSGLGRARALELGVLGLGVLGVVREPPRLLRLPRSPPLTPHNPSSWGYCSGAALQGEEPGVHLKQLHALFPAPPGDHHRKPLVLTYVGGDNTLVPPLLALLCVISFSPPSTSGRAFANLALPNARC
jgi:hypothetical protein